MMRAAERLFAEHGVTNVTIRDILAGSGQKNESALQYHFGNLAGLIAAIHEERSEQIRQQRGIVLTQLLETQPSPKLRDICKLMILPNFQLARANVDFRRYIKAFGHEIALARAPLEIVSSKGGGGNSGVRLGQLLFEALPHLDEASYRRRMDSAIIFSATSMYRQARSKNAFRGPASDLFLEDLVDALEGLLSAPVSKETRQLAKQNNKR